MLPLGHERLFDARKIAKLLLSKAALFAELAYQVHSASILIRNCIVNRKVSGLDSDMPEAHGLASVMARIGPKKPVRWFLLEWREYKGLTQEQVAERMDTNKGQVQKLENGKQRMNDRWIAGFAHAFDIEPSRLLQHPESPSADELLRQASPEQRRQVQAVIEAILKAS